MLFVCLDRTPFHEKSDEIIDIKATDDDNNTANSNVYQKTYNRITTFNGHLDFSLYTSTRLNYDYELPSSRLLQCINWLLQSTPANRKTASQIYDFAMNILHETSSSSSALNIR